MILACIEQLKGSENMLRSALELSSKFNKSCALSLFLGRSGEVKRAEEEVQSFLLKKGFKGFKVFVHNKPLDTLTKICEENEISFLFLQLTTARTKEIQQGLDACRELRIPYVLYKEDFAPLKLEKVLAPVTFLEEEYEKAQFLSAFGRFFHSEIILLVAKDYGSKATATAEKMGQLFAKFALNYRMEKAQKDSFGVEKEAIQRAVSENAGLILISASRDYGLDDLIFGPKERHLIKKSTLPILLVNPRGDLYALCD